GRLRPGAVPRRASRRPRLREGRRAETRAPRSRRLPRRRRTAGGAVRAVLAALVALAAARPAGAAGPLLVNGAGTPHVWTVTPVPFNPDRGTLGAIDNGTAVGMVTSDFGVWAAVPT